MSSANGLYSVLPRVAVCCCVLLCVAVCCSVLQWVAVGASVALACLQPTDSTGV